VTIIFEQFNWGTLVSIVFVVQVVFVCLGVYKEHQGLSRFGIAQNHSPNLTDETWLRNFEEWLAWATKLPVYVIFPFLGWLIDAWRPPVLYVADVLLGWSFIGPVLIVIFSLQIGVFPAGFVYTYLVFSSTGSSDARFLFYGFLPSLISGLIYTIIKRHNLARDATQLTKALLHRGFEE